ncbi:N-acetyltransferase [Staphylococcus chromogenes]|uniref:N-acetyltransferase n=1 Tax=Staphylococcus chromogenes TaxID=46126 RepID=A0AAE5T188_STACR|nr:MULTISPECIES: GNAT family N-acetyltransferase [Staphylococcus]KDP12720.1 GNAT family acetyltransferase [Staphylococcus chromogenes MU 970]MBV5137436.1 GNAT family N-acetyltransferase [Staphylococcus chromogenes]MBV5191342.1 GNAT family N-acetyltransferase [Staphylococcus chromogenes]MBW3132305.1 GNAT family N-acetyltransferase [Staphylococcus chromogenes]MBW6088301.1 GNAT family N-acetyltransferase [Staphylococcus chromogenes]
MKVTQVTSVDRISNFIKENVSTSQSYTNKLPLQYDKAYDMYLEEAIQTTGIFVLEENGAIQMALICIPYLENRYKVIGPITQKDYLPTGDAFELLFNAATSSHAKPATYYFAYAAENEHIKAYMKTIGASYTFTDYHLSTHTDLGETENIHHIIDYKPAYFKYFKKLHEDTFSHNAMRAEEIVETLDTQHQLKLYMAEGILKGYLYLILNPNEGHAEIRYFSSHTHYRLKGIAFDLIQHAIHEALAQPDIHDVYFKIRSKNHRLVERFHEFGFEMTSEYRKFKLVR